MADIIDFQQRQGFAATFQQITRFFGKESVGPTAERRHFHKLHIGGLAYLLAE